MAAKASGKRPRGRPRKEMVLLPPKLIPMTDKEYDEAVDALAELIVEWMQRNARAEAEEARKAEAPKRAARVIKPRKTAATPSGDATRTGKAKRPPRTR